MEVDIRPCRRDDCGAVLEVWRRAGSLPTATDDLAALERLMERACSTLLVAVRAGTVVGTAIAGFDGWRGAVYRLAVVPEERRRGVARRLLDACEAWLRDQGAVRLHVTVALTEEHAVGFWESAPGWERDRRALRFTRTLDSGCDRGRRERV
jgi:ribosomal protein S18 acetylase RimI-like enzyme